MQSIKNNTGPVVDIKHLNVIYNQGKSNEHKALKDVNLEIFSGEYIILFGPSGCGKSTLLYSIAGLQSPTSGDVIIDGINISKLGKGSKKLVDFHRSKMSIIFQAFHLIPSLDVFSNIALPAVFMDTPASERSQKVKVLLERFGITKEKKRLPSELSGGQMQRVAIARSLINNPSIILADEPVGNLDSKSADTVLDILKDINRENKVIIFVTHDSRYLNFADRVFYIEDGVIIKETINRDKRPASARDKDKQNKYKIPDTSKEFEFLTKSYPELASLQARSSLNEFKAQQFIQEILTSMSGKQVKKIESLVSEHLEKNEHKNISRYVMQNLDAPESDGGVGLDSRTAKKVTEKMEDIMQKVEYLLTAEEKQLTVKEKSKYLCDYIFDKFVIKNRTDEKVLAFQKALALRIDNKIDGDQFNDYLDKPISDGGAGMDARNARKITYEIELIMLMIYKK